MSHLLATGIKSNSIMSSTSGSSDHIIDLVQSPTAQIAAELPLSSQPLECIICYDLIMQHPSEHSLATTFCGHLFGRSCLKEALSCKDECPKCRTSFRKKRKVGVINIYDASVVVTDRSATLDAEREKAAKIKVRDAVLMDCFMLMNDMNAGYH